MSLYGRHLLIASLPAALIRAYDLGAQSRAWLLMLLCALAVSFGWAAVFARLRGRPVDPVWIPAAWLFSLMLPPTVPLGFAAVVLSFGLVFGCHVFGGSGRYLVNPALLGVVFLAIAYPTVAGTDASIGSEVDAIRIASVIASLIGAVYLVALKQASASIVAGGLIALTAGGALDSEMSWTAHLAAGHFAFALAFVATDPTTRPGTVSGSWVFGALFGLLVVAFRTLNPAHPEGSWAALLLASLFIPLIDHVARSFAGPRSRSSDA